MKKFTLTTLLILVFVVSIFAKKVEINDARQAGKNFYYEMANAGSTVSYQSINLIGDHTWNAGGETAFYIFNVNMDDGYVIVAADDAVQPVLGYSFTGSFSEENLPPQMREWLNTYAREIDYIRDLGLQADLELTGRWNHLLTSDPSTLQPDRLSRAVEPLLTSSWDQTFPYNAMCPEDAASGSGYNGRVPVGCVATAMAQIMYYWRFPDQGTGSHCISPIQPEYGQQCADFANTTYVWEGMNDSPTGECDPIALLSWHCGISVNMHYGPDGSGAQVSAVDNALINYFKYANSAQWIRKTNYSSTDWKTC